MRLVWRHNVFVLTKGHGIRYTYSCLDWINILYINGGLDK